MTTGVIVLIVIAVIVVIALVWGVATYNGFVRLRNLVQEAWRQIDVELHRRHDLIPNLVETVKGYAAHERGVFDEVTRARAAAAGSTSGPAEQAAQENQLTAGAGSAVRRRGELPGPARERELPAAAGRSSPTPRTASPPGAGSTTRTCGS